MNTPIRLQFPSLFVNRSVRICFYPYIDEIYWVLKHHDSENSFLTNGLTDFLIFYIQNGSRAHLVVLSGVQSFIGVDIIRVVGIIYESKGLLTIQFIKGKGWSKSIHS